VAYAVGDVVAGRYEIQAAIGQRPLGFLYRAREREIGVEVALRVIGHPVLPDEGARVAFTQRLTRARAFSHASLVRVFGVYPQKDSVVVAVQWAPGSTLADRVKEKRFTMEEARPLITQVAGGMSHAHQHGVILGDVHAQTVVLLGSNVKISNVGIGPSLPRKRFLEAVRSSPGFRQLAPEIRNGSPADTRADVFSLGMLLVEMMTGGDDREAVDGPAPLHAVLGRALADDPMLRHTSVEALAQELDAVLSGQPMKVRRPTPPVGVPAISATREPQIEDATGPVKRADRRDEKPKTPPSETSEPRDPPDQHPSQELTRSMSDDELRLLKGDQITRQVPEDEIFALRVQSSDTHEVELADLDADEQPTRTGDDLALERSIEAPPADEDEIEPETREVSLPANRDGDDLKTDQVVLLEADAVRTGPVNKVDHDEVDTHRVEKAQLDELADVAEPPTVVADAARDARPPSLPDLTDDLRPATLDGPAPTLEPPPTSRNAQTGDRPPSLPSLADAPEPETTVDPSRQRRADDLLDPLLDAKPPTIDARSKAARVLEPKRPVRDDEPTTTHETANKRTLPVDEEGPTNTATPLPPPAPASSLPSLPSTPNPIAARPSEPQREEPKSPPKRKRRNPFEPQSPGESEPPPKSDARKDDARNGEAKAPPRKRKNPFEAPAAGPPPSVATPLSSEARRGSRRPPPKPTALVSPIGHPRRVPLVAVLAAATILGAVLTAMYMSHRVREERLAEERIAKQRLADDLRAQAEAMRKLSLPDAGAKPESKPLVTPAETTLAPLPRAGACPLGAHLVAAAGASRAFCVDVYEYPGGNTLPRTNVGFAEAAHICAQRGERLCSDGEWERACRGKNNASYPYGATFDATRCNTRGNSGALAPTGTFASCKSASGAYDMSGNVAEWVASGGQKGGAAQNGAKESRCSATAKNVGKDGSAFVGFRCCADPAVSRR
jgi:serine/threonine protein kinase